MIESTTYMDSVIQQELVPQFTLNMFENPEDEWNMREMMEMFQRIDDQFNGNMQHNFVCIINRYEMVCSLLHIFSYRLIKG